MNPGLSLQGQRNTRTEFRSSPEEAQGSKKEEGRLGIARLPDTVEWLPRAIAYGIALSSRYNENI